MFENSDSEQIIEEGELALIHREHTLFESANDQNHSDLPSSSTNGQHSAFSNSRK